MEHNNVLHTLQHHVLDLALGLFVVIFAIYAIVKDRFMSKTAIEPEINDVTKKQA